MYYGLVPLATIFHHISAIKNDQEAVFNELFKNPAMADADLGGSGVESAHGPHRPVNTQWPLTLKDWRWAAEPNHTALSYLDDRKQDFRSGAIAEASTNGDRLIAEYGSYSLASGASHEHMIGKKDY